MPADPTRFIALTLAQGSAWHALDLALSAAKRAGEEALSKHQHLPPAEQFALALQAADEVLEGLAVELAGDDQGEKRNGT